jgi:hypothetical protein
MGIRAWMIKSWPQQDFVLSTLDRSKRKPAGWPHFCHTATTLHAADALHKGETVWLTDMGNRCVALAWEWAELRPGVPVMADPNSIITNLRLRAETGLAIDDLRQVSWLNQMIYQLPWQHSVAAAVRIYRLQQDVKQGLSHGAVAA